MRDVVAELIEWAEADNRRTLQFYKRGAMLPAWEVSINDCDGRWIKATGHSISEAAHKVCEGLEKLAKA